MKNAVVGPKTRTEEVEEEIAFGEIAPAEAEDMRQEASNEDDYFGQFDHEMD